MTDEKFDEKGMEKRDEKPAEEKSWDEKWRNDPLSAIIWAMIFIWAGVVFLVSNLGLLDSVISYSEGTGFWGTLERIGGAWSIVLIGAGVIILGEVAIRLLVPAYRRPVTGSLIFAVILIGLGLGDLISWSLIWPTILIVLGLSIILRGLRRE